MQVGALKEKLRLEIIYTDFSDAFQSVNHRLLLHKLEATYGISGPLLALFQSYPTNAPEGPYQRLYLWLVTSS